MTTFQEPQPQEEEPHQHITRSSQIWTNDNAQNWCTRCASSFNPITNRRHHCRLCGLLFCEECSQYKCLIPPSLIVLYPKSAASSAASSLIRQNHKKASFTPDLDPEGVLTMEKVTSSSSSASKDQSNANGAMSPIDGAKNKFKEEDEDEALFSSVNMIQNGLQTNMVYGKNIEQRYKLARDPQRVCLQCYDQLHYLQSELRMSNANCVRLNAIDPSDVRRLFNSPLAFTLGHEVRKAAYTLNNLLPLPKRMGIVSSYDYGRGGYDFDSSSSYSYNQFYNNDQCEQNCQTTSPNLGDLDGMRIPAKLIERAKGLAFLTVVRASAGIGFEIGTGLAIARLRYSKVKGKLNSRNNAWSAPNAIGTVGVSWGAQLGAQVSDHVFLLMTDEAVNIMFHNTGSIQLGADVAISIGPLGRSVEADFSLDANLATAPIYTYSLSKGLYIGASLDGKVITTRHDINEKFYGTRIHPNDLRSGEVPCPPAAQPLYDALKRCHVYVSSNSTNSPSLASAAYHQTSTNRLDVPSGNRQNTTDRSLFNESFKESEETNGNDDPSVLSSPHEETVNRSSNDLYDFDQEDVDLYDDECDIGILPCSFPLPTPPRTVRNINVSNGSSDGRKTDTVEWPF